MLDQRSLLADNIRIQLRGATEQYSRRVDQLGEGVSFPGD